MSIDISKPLYDNDGFQHHYVAGNSREIVTKISGIYVIWDARTGECLKQGSEGATLGNEPLPPEELDRRKMEGARILAELHAQAYQERSKSFGKYPHGRLFAEGEFLVILQDHERPHEFMIPVLPGAVVHHVNHGEVEIRYDEERGWHYLRLGYAGVDRDLENLRFP